MSKMDEKEAESFSNYGQKLTLKIEEFKIPVIAAINGFALGGGCEFAMACHIRYASENAVDGNTSAFTVSAPDVGSNTATIAANGKGMAMEILLGAKNITADEACRIGLENKVVSLSELIPTVEKLAISIIKNAPIAITATINSVNSSSKANLIQGLACEKKEFSKLFTSKDTKEGLSAFVDKRSPNFTGE
jgi:enoyl-CoA hydratase